MRSGGGAADGDGPVAPAVVVPNVVAVEERPFEGLRAGGDGDGAGVGAVFLAGEKEVLRILPAVAADVEVEIARGAQRV